MAQELQAKLTASGRNMTVEIFVSQRLNTGFPQRNVFQHLAEIVPQLFRGYDALFFVMAAGIVVRTLAPCLQSKLTDPAVLVIDEKGQNVISLLSGHVGGANALALLTAKMLQARPVLTTATDVQGYTAPDAVAAELGLRPEPKRNIKYINQRLLLDQPVTYIVDRSLPQADYFAQYLLTKNLPVTIEDVQQMTMEDACVCITEHKLDDRENLLLLRPRKLVAGIGCRRGTAMHEICSALSWAAKQVGRSPADISAVASVSIKSNEAGLLLAAEKLGVKLVFFDTAALQVKIQEYFLEESAFVKQQIGAGNVCEAAALCCVQNGRIALQKTKLGKVTVALVWER